MTEEKLSHILLCMTYGDALGFANENQESKTRELKSFLYRYNHAIEIKKPIGQYSYITELSLITLKSLVDAAEDFRVTVDYKRFYEELKLWKYYRHGKPVNLLSKLNNVHTYYTSSTYWQDIRGHGFSRIIPITLANKNLHAGEIEIYKNILYLNRYPQVLLTALLLSRTIYLLMEKGFYEKQDLIRELKEYLIDFQWRVLEINKNLPKNYSIQFEKEKIQYIMTLDRMVIKAEEKYEALDSKGIFLEGLNIYYKLQELQPIEINGLVDGGDLKEALAIGYGLWGIHTKALPQEIDLIKDKQFINNMGQYLYKIRNYEINRKAYIKGEDQIDIFNLKKGSSINHPVLNIGKVKDRIETDEYIQLFLETKSGIYTFIKEKRQ